jgi:sugar phosphate isomerase/epimerase
MTRLVRPTFATIVLVPRGGWAPLPSPDQRRRAFDWAARAGFAGIEISPRWLDFGKVDAEELASVRDEIHAAGLSVSGINVNRAILTRTDRAAEHAAGLARAIEVAAGWDAPTVTVSLAMPTIPGPDRPPLRGQDFSAGELARSGEILARLARRAAAIGVALSLELHDDGPLDSAPACLALLDAIGEANVGVHPDLGNICRGPGAPPDWEATLVALAPHANAWSVKNYRDGVAVALADGVIDYARAVSIMERAGFRGWVGIETYFGDDPLAVQEQNLRYLQRLIGS